MKKARMNISHFRFIFNLKIFGEIVTTNINPLLPRHRLRQNNFTKIKIPACYRLIMKNQKIFF